MSIITIGQKILAKRGFELKYQSQPIYADPAKIEQAITLIKGYTMLSRSTLVSLADQIAYCNKVDLEGAFVECGVWKGGAVALMAYISKQTGRPDRALHLFDAFQDICPPDPKVDGEKALNETKKFGSYQEGDLQPLSGVYDRFGGHGTIDACKEVIGKTGYPSANVHFHQGWFQDTVKEASKSIPKISLLRLDGDWYESTMVCLQAFYDQVVPGGFIIFDDYGAYEGCRKAVHDFFDNRNVRPFLVRADTACYFVIKH